MIAPLTRVPNDQARFTLFLTSTWQTVYDPVTLGGCRTQSRSTTLHQEGGSDQTRITMKNWRKARRLSFSIPLMLLVMAAMSIGPATTALAQGMASGAQAGTRQAPPPIEPFSEVSDPRAEHLDHTNVTTCTGAAPGGLGLPAGTIQVGTSPKSNTSGTVTSGPITYRIYTNNLNTSTWSTNTAALIDITVAPGTTVLAVAVKGGDGTNVYTPPNVPPGQTVAFRSPLNNGGRLPTISHWIVCYSFTPPPPPDDDGSITVTKVVKGPGGVPVTALPSSYSATVACTGHSPQTVTAPESGGRFDPNPLVFTPPTTCTVTETTIDPRATVTYSVDGGPPSSSPPSVPIQSGTPHLVTITNDFSNAPILMGELHLQKVVTNPGDATLPQDWTAQVHCDLAAGDLTETVTMPLTVVPGTRSCTRMWEVDARWKSSMSRPAGR